MPRLIARSLAPLGWCLLFATAAVVLLAWNATAREVATDALQLAFAFFSTPFIFEVTSALLFVGGLLAYNRWRLLKEGDGWVYLMCQEPDAKDLPTALNQRLQSTVLDHKPEPIDEAGAETGVIEGFLELGMAAQAERELASDTTSHPPLDAAILRIRVLAANLATETATSLLRDTAKSAAGLDRALATVAIENAQWLLQHVHREDLARHWLAEARALDPTAIVSGGGDELLGRLA